MSYFGPEFVRFFRALARHNTRAWYQAHRDEVVRHCKGPFEDFGFPPTSQAARF